MSKDFHNHYMIFNGALKYFIVPSCEILDVLPEPNGYLSFWFLHNAKTVCKAMNAAWRDGNRYNSLFGEK